MDPVLGLLGQVDFRLVPQLLQVLRQLCVALPQQVHLLGLSLELLRFHQLFAQVLNLSVRAGDDTLVVLQGLFLLLAFVLALLIIFFERPVLHFHRVVVVLQRL